MISNSEAGPVECLCFGISSLFELHLLEAIPGPIGLIVSVALHDPNRSSKQRRGLQ